MEEHERILIVEDDPASRLLLTKQLDRLGFHSAAVSTAAEALAYLITASPQLILLDCHLPDMDGADVAVTLRRDDPRGRHIPIIAVTGTTVPAEIRSYVDAGVDEVILKPVRLEDLSDLLGRWLPGGTPSVGAIDQLEHDPLANLSREVSAEDAQEVVEIYLSELPGRLDAIEAGLAAADTEATALAAHALVSASMMFDAPGFIQVARSMEHAAKAGDLGAARAAWKPVRDGAHDLRTSLVLAASRLLWPS